MGATAPLRTRDPARSLRRDWARTPQTPRVWRYLPRDRHRIQTVRTTLLRPTLMPPEARTRPAFARLLQADYMNPFRYSERFETPPHFVKQRGGRNVFHV